MEQITFHNSNNQLLYFTSTSIIGDNDQVVFLSDRTGSVNLFIKDLKTDVEKQLTFYTKDILKSYVYFEGTAYEGFGKASVSVDAERKNIYYIYGREICVVHCNGEQRTLNTLPKGQMTGFTHVSGDGKLLCIPTVDEEAFDVSDNYFTNIDRKVLDQNLSSYLRIYDTQTGKELHCEEVNKAWITHVQFCPTDSNKILYNHEWTCEDSGIRRMWLYDGTQHIRLRNCDQNRFREDWACHEMWEKNGNYIIYHGGYKNGENKDCCFIGRIDIRDNSYVEIPIPKEYKTYGHFTVGETGMLVSDGYYYSTPEDNDNWAGKWISVQQIDWSKKIINWVPIVRHESSFQSQCSHPHPIFDHKDKYIYFTSDCTGKRQIYRALAPNKN